MLFACFLSCYRAVTTTPCPLLSVVKPFPGAGLSVGASRSVGAPHPLPCGNSRPREPALGGLTVGCTAFSAGNFEYGLWHCPFLWPEKEGRDFFWETRAGLGRRLPFQCRGPPAPPSAPMGPTDPSAVTSWGTPPPASSLSLSWSVGGSGGLKSPKTTGHSGIFTDLVRGSLSRHILLAFSLGSLCRVEQGAFQDVDEAELC